MSGVKIDVYSFQHQNIGTATTDNAGAAVIKCSGKPFYLIASSGRATLPFASDRRLRPIVELFRRKSGQVVQKGIKGFIYGDRGVWRPGDTVHLGFMLNDREGKIPADMPVVMELYTPRASSTPPVPPRAARWEHTHSTSLRNRMR